MEKFDYELDRDTMNSLQNRKLGRNFINDWFVSANISN